VSDSDLKTQVNDTIFNYKKNNHMTHAYLIECKDIEMHDILAKEIAKIILCNEYQINNHLHCKKCNEIENNNSLEFEVVKPEGLTIKIDQARKLQSKMNKKALTSSGKVYAIEQADKISIQTANSMLKFIEEPLENVYALLIAQNIYNLPITLRSRCQIIKYKTKQTNKIIDSDFIQQIIIQLETKGTKYIADSALYNSKIDKNYLIQIINSLIEVYRRSVDGDFVEFSEETKNILVKIEFKGLQKRIFILSDLLKKTETNMNINMIIDKLIIEIGGIK
jgi:DNA polymerase III delta prime subunit